MTKANDFDAQIAVCRQKIQSLMAQIAEEQHRIEQEHVKKEFAEEQNRQKLLDEIRQQIKQKTLQIEEQVKEAEAVQEDLKKLDDRMLEKLQQMNAVTKDIRKENLNGLSIENSSYVDRSASADLSSPLMSTSKLVAGGNVSTVGGFYNRIGSTRKMVGYPRELESAVATNKNPNGVWV
jgi:SMC interacting uncharacterized protein involved in chromosome segregation